MKKEWSPKWTGSTQARKQRKYRANAPLHVKRKFLSASLAKELRTRYGRRSLSVRKGDEVVVISGKAKKTRGIVERVDLRKSKVYVDSVKAKKVDGTEVMRALEPSNLRITKINLDDKMRKKGLQRKPGVKIIEEKTRPPAKSEQSGQAVGAKPANPQPTKAEVQKPEEKTNAAGKVTAKPMEGE